MNLADIRLSKERRPDWARMIANLQKAGMSLQEIADTIEVGKSTLYGYLSEDCPSEPAYYAGHSLLALWCTRCGCALADMPIREVPMSVSAMLKAMR